MNDHDQAVLDASMDAQCWDDPCRPEPAVTAFLPDSRLRCSALWYAQRAGLLTGNPAPDEDDLEFLRELGYQAACRARWEGVPEWRVREGPWIVNMWPERVWSLTADAMARAAADHGGWHLGRPDPPSAAIPRDPSCDRCNYDAHRCPGCGEPLPHGWAACAPCTEVCAGCDRPRPGDSFWSYPAPPEDTMAYADWCQMADGLSLEEDRILRGAYGPDEPVPPMRTRVVHSRRELFDVLVDRTTPWGNPFVIGRDGTRDQVIAAYEAYLRSRPDLMAALPLLRGKVLGCHCAPQACHGDVLARYADADPPSAAIPGHQPGPCACRVCGGRYCHGCAECNDYAAAADDATWDLRMKYTDLTCIRCGREFTSWSEDGPPKDGLLFTSYGNYGSTVYDPQGAGLEYLAIAVCDACAVSQARAGNVMHVCKAVSPPPPPPRYRGPWIPDDGPS